MYGPTPNIIIENVESPPPENTFNILNNWLPANTPASLAWSTPGIGIAANMRNTTKKNTINSTRLRRFLSVNIDFSFAKNVFILLLYH